MFFDRSWSLWWLREQLYGHVASLASGETETVTLVASVNCSVVDGTLVSNTATVSSSTLDPNTTNNSATITTTASNPPPVITGAAADPSVLWPPNHRMINVTVSYDVTDNGALPPGSCTLTVTSNEPVLSHGSGHTSPDWTVLGIIMCYFEPSEQATAMDASIRLRSPAPTAAAIARPIKWR